MDTEHDNGSDSSLMMIKKKVPNGFIINHNVFLTETQYNTLVTVDEYVVQCAVCTVLCTVEECAEHVNSEDHDRNMMRNPPLEKYDLSIIRKVQNRHHCGVCNKLFDPEASDDHLSTKTHENNLLFAINKVTDITYDTDSSDKEECYHFNARLINDENFREEERSVGLYVDYWQDSKLNEEYEEQIDDECIPIVEEIGGHFSYVNAARKPKTLPKYVETEVKGRKLKILFNSWHMIIMLKPNRYYCMVCKTNGQVGLMPSHCTSDSHISKLASCLVMEKYELHLIRKMDDRLYHCAHCNNLQLISDIDDHIECSHPIVRNRNITENSLAIKSKEKNASYTKNGNIMAKPGNAATKPGSSDTKPDNTVTKSSHTVAKNSITTANCDNNVTKLGVTVPNCSNTDTKPGNSMIKLGITVTKSGNIVTKPGNTDCMSNSADGEMELHMFNAKFKLSPLSYNMVLNDDQHYCCVCEQTVNTEHLARHVKEVFHIECVNRTPFINEFSIHLIRLVRKYLHCAVCNVLVEHSFIYKHVKEAVHLRYLHKAMAIPIGTSNIDKEKASTSKEAIVDDNQFRILDQTINETEGEPKVLPNQNIHNGNDTTNIQEVHETGVKNDTIKEAVETNTDNRTDPEELMNFEEFVLLRRKNIYFKITVTSFNTLVAVGDGSRHCTLCSVQVADDLKKHMESRCHTDNIHKYKFLENYEQNLLRQIYHTYHCALCNVTFTRREVKTHLSWPVHLRMISSSKQKKSKRMEIGCGLKQMHIEYQKERLYTTDVAPQIKIGACYQFTANMERASHKNKILLYNGNVLKISWHSWNSFIKSKAGLKCSLCKMGLSVEELSWHATSSDHRKKLKKNFLIEYLPAVIRKVNEDTLNCVTCNTEVANDEKSITDHIKGKAHERSSEEASSGVSSYEDCDEDVFTIL